MACLLCLLLPAVECEVDGPMCARCHEACESIVCARENGPVDDYDPLDDYDAVVDLLEWAAAQ